MVSHPACSRNFAGQLESTLAQKHDEEELLALQEEYSQALQTGGLLINFRMSLTLHIATMPC